MKQFKHKDLVVENIVSIYGVPITGIIKCYHYDKSIFPCKSFYTNTIDKCNGYKIAIGEINYCPCKAGGDRNLEWRDDIKWG